RAPGSTLARDLPQPEPGAAKEAGAEWLQESAGQLDAVIRTDKRMPVAEVAHARLRRDVDRKDLAWQPGGERHHPLRLLRLVLRHEDGAAAHGTFEHAAEAAASAELSRRRHHDARRHP